jgi:glycosyltransferase involved in cell wall biosynthesis
MKIVVTGTRGIPGILGGVETHCQELFPRMATDDKYDITIIRRKSYALDSLSEYKNISLIDIVTPKNKSFEAIIHTFKAIRKAKKMKADIVHIHAIGPALLTPFARLLGMKVVFTHHGADYDRDKWGRVARLILKAGERMGCTFANEVIVISEVINQIVKNKYKRYDAHLIYNGVPAPNFIQSTLYLDQLGVEPQKYIFAMGRFVPEKNFHHLIKAYTFIRHLGYKLVLAGDTDFEDNYSKELKSQAQKEDVVLTGFIKGEKLDTLLTHARLFVLPSSHEGLPIALLEAMNYHLPVVVSNIPANLEIGLTPESYFQVGNEKELAQKIELAFQKDQKVFYDMKNYCWDKIAEQTMDVYKKLSKHS